MFTTEYVEKALSNNDNQIYLCSPVPALDAYATGSLVSAIQNISRTNPRKISLLLNDNAIGDEGCKELAKLGTTSNLSIERLDVEDNDIGDLGVKALCQLKELHTLVVANNRISGDGLIYLVQNSPQLTKLSASGNNLNDDDASALLKVKNSSLVDLCLDNAGISESFLAKIDQWVIGNQARLEREQVEKKDAAKESKEKKQTEKNEEDVVLSISISHTKSAPQKIATFSIPSLEEEEAKQFIEEVGKMVQGFEKRRSSLHKSQPQTTNTQPT